MGTAPGTAGGGVGGIPGSRLRRVVQTGLGILEKAAASDQKRASEAGMDKNTPYEQRLTKTARERNQAAEERAQRTAGGMVPRQGEAKPSRGGARGRATSSGPPSSPIGAKRKRPRPGSSSSAVAGVPGTPGGGGGGGYGGRGATPGTPGTPGTPSRGGAMGRAMTPTTPGGTMVQFDRGGGGSRGMTPQSRGGTAGGGLRSEGGGGGGGDTFFGDASQDETRTSKTKSLGRRRGTQRTGHPARPAPPAPLPLPTPAHATGRPGRGATTSWRDFIVGTLHLYVLSPSP